MNGKDDQGNRGDVGKIILQLWSQGTRGKKDEAVDKFAHLTRDTDLDNIYIDKKITGLLVSAFNNGMADLIVELDTKMNFSIYEVMIAEAVSRLDIPFIEKLMKHIMDVKGNYEYYQKAVVSYLQRGHHYGVNFGTSFGTCSLGSLQEIIDGTRERIGDSNVYQNEYCNRICGIIQFEDGSLWNKLNKSNWTNTMFNHFYYKACTSLNTHVVREIERLASSTDDNANNIVILYGYKVLKCIQFRDIDGYISLQRMIDEIKQGEVRDVRLEDFAEYLWGVVYSRHRNNFELIDLFINNFGFNFMKTSLLNDAQDAKTNKYLTITRDKNFLFHLIKRGLFQHSPETFDNYSLTFIRGEQEDIKDICFLISHGLTNFNSLRRLLYYSDIFENLDDNLATLFLRLQGKPVLMKLFSESERDEIKNHLENRKCLLNQYLLSELVSIIMFYTF
jgi:hypothetical protein